MQKIAMILCVILLLLEFNCWAEGLGTLIELGKSQAEIQNQYARETKTFESVKRAIEDGAVKKGMDKASVLAKYGEPVVRLDNPDGKGEYWIYKPAESSFFEGVKATLSFTGEGVLEKVSVEE